MISRPRILGPVVRPMRTRTPDGAPAIEEHPIDVRLAQDGQVGTGASRFQVGIVGRDASIGGAVDRYGEMPVEPGALRSGCQG